MIFRTKPLGYDIIASESKKENAMSEYCKYGENLTRAAEALDVSRNTVRKYL